MDALKYVGIALVAAALFVCGLVISHSQSEPLKIAKAFVALITRLRGHIEYSRGSLRRLLAEGGRRRR